MEVMMTTKDLSIKWWWHGLIEDLYLACKCVK